MITGNTKTVSILSIKNILFGLLSRLLEIVVKKSDCVVIFGSSNGSKFNENSKYLFEYMSANSEFDCYWVTRSDILYHDLKVRGVKVLHNYKFKDLLIILSARVCVISTNVSDVLFWKKKMNCLHVNLFHGMPIKKIVYDFDKFLLSISLSDRIKRFLINKIICVDWTKSDIIISQSDFFNRYLSSAFRNSRIFVTGQPRNDVLFTRSRGELDFGFEIIQNASRRILYMPTHRLYGKGKKEFPLLHSLSFYEFLESLNGVFLFKYHPNMPVSKDVMLNDRFFDISNCGFDVQELLVEADLLISDYSSVVFDYMLLKRIIIFYLYDNYEESNPIYFSLKNVMPYIAYNESELEKLIISVYADTSDSVEFNDKFNAYKDGQSSKRVSDLIKLNLHM